jgi:hypothetical protein
LLIDAKAPRVLGVDVARSKRSHAGAGGDGAFQAQDLVAH